MTRDTWWYKPPRNHVKNIYSTQVSILSLIKTDTKKSKTTKKKQLLPGNVDYIPPTDVVIPKYIFDIEDKLPNEILPLNIKGEKVSTESIEKARIYKNKYHAYKVQYLDQMKGVFIDEGQIQKAFAAHNYRENSRKELYKIAATNAEKSMRIAKKLNPEGRFKTSLEAATQLLTMHDNDFRSNVDPTPEEEMIYKTERKELVKKLNTAKTNSLKAVKNPVLKTSFLDEDLTKNQENLLKQSQKYWERNRLILHAIQAQGAKKLHKLDRSKVPEHNLSTFLEGNPQYTKDDFFKPTPLDNLEGLQSTLPVTFPKLGHQTLVFDVSVRIVEEPKEESKDNHVSNANLFYHKRHTKVEKSMNARERRKAARSLLFTQGSEIEVEEKLPSELSSKLTYLLEDGTTFTDIVTETGLSSIYNKDTKLGNTDWYKNTGKTPAEMRADIEYEQKIVENYEDYWLVLDIFVSLILKNDKCIIMKVDGSKSYIRLVNETAYDHIHSLLLDVSKDNVAQIRVHTERDHVQINVGGGLWSDLYSTTSDRDGIRDFVTSHLKKPSIKHFSSEESEIIDLSCSKAFDCGIIDRVKIIVGSGLESTMSYLDAIRSKFEELVRNSEVMEQVKKLGSKIAEMDEYIELICHIIAYLTSIATDVNVFMRASYTSLLVEKIFLWMGIKRNEDTKWIMNFITASLTSLIYLFGPSRSKALNTQGSAVATVVSYSELCTKFFTTALTSEASMAIRNLIVSVATLKMLPLSGAQTVWKYFDKPKKTGMIDVLLSSFQNINQVIKSIGCWVETGNWKIALNCGSEISKQIVEAELLLLNKENIYFGSKVQNKVEFSQYLKELWEMKKILEESEKHFRECPTSKITRVTIRKTIKALEDVYYEIETKFVCSDRIPPLIVVLSGGAKIGKGNLVKLIWRIYCEVAGIEFSPGQIWTKDKNSKFYDTYHGPSHPCMYFDEVGSESSELTKRMTDFLINEILGFVDSNAKSLNMAFEGKGKTFFGSKLIIINTNQRIGEHAFRFLHMDKFLDAPIAGLRRLNVADLDLLPKYCFPGTTAIDPSRCNDGTYHYDRYKISFCKFDPTTLAPGYVKQYINGMNKREGDDIYKFEEALHQLFTAHLNAETKLKSKLEFVTEGIDTTPIFRKKTSIYLSKFFMKWYRIFDAYGLAYCRRQSLLPSPIKGFVMPPYLGLPNKQLFHAMHKHLKGYKPSYTLKWTNYLGPNTWMGKEQEFIRPLQFHTDKNGMRPVVDYASDAVNQIDYDKTRINILKLQNRSQSFFSSCELHSQGGIPEAVMNEDITVQPEISKMVKKTKFETEMYALFHMFADILFFMMTILGNCVGEKFCINYISSIPFCLAYAIVVFLAGHSVVPVLSIIFLVNAFCLSAACSFMIMKDNRIETPSPMEMIVTSYAKYKMRSKGIKEILMRDWVKITAVFGVIAFAFGVMGILKDALFPYKKKSLFTESTVFHIEDESNAPLNDEEEKVEAGKSFQRLSPKVKDTQWENHRILKSSGKHTSDPKLLYSKLLGNVRWVHIISGSYTIGSNAIGISNNIMIVNKHNFHGLQFPIRVQIFVQPFENDECHGPTTITTSRETHLDSPEDIIDLGNDICAILVPDQFKDISNHLPLDSDFGEYGSFSYSGYGSKGKFLDWTLKYDLNRTMRVTEDVQEIYGFATNHVHYDGKCGMPIIVKKGTGWCFAGIHAAGGITNIGETSFCALFQFPQYTKAKNYFDAKNIKEKNFFLHSEGTLPVECSEPNPSSMIFYEDLSGLKYHGKEPGKILTDGKSSLVRNKCYDMLQISEIMFEEFGFQRTVQFEAPLMGIKKGKTYISPYNIGVVPMNHFHPGLKKKICNFIVQDEVRRIVELFKSKFPGQKVSPIDIETAVNGAREDDFISRINASTSAGHGYKGKKGDYLPIVWDEPMNVIREPDHVVKAKVLEMIRKYRSGENCFPINNVALKDEPRERAKVIEGKTRLFYVAVLEMIIMSRMFFSPYYSLFMQFPKEFNTAIGINMHKDADEWYDHLTEFSDLMMETDYSKFDTTIIYDIRQSAYRIKRAVLKELGYNDDAMKIVDGLITDLLFPTISVLKDIFVVCGLHPSGADSTAQHNCDNNKFMVRYFYEDIMRTLGYDTSPDSPWYFYKNVRLSTLGDDEVAAVKRVVAEWINNISFAAYCTQFYNMKCTPSAKGQDFVAFQSPSTMSFLKRTFRYHNDLGRTVGLLDMNSLYKTLEWRLPSKSEAITEEDHVLSAASSVLKELVFHCDRRQYTRFLDIVSQNLSAYYMALTPERTIKALLSYDEQLEALSKTAAQALKTESHDYGSTPMSMRGILIKSEADDELPQGVILGKITTGLLFSAASNYFKLLEALRALLVENDQEFKESQSSKNPLSLQEYERRREEIERAIARHTETALDTQSKVLTTIFEDVPLTNKISDQQMVDFINSVPVDIPFLDQVKKLEELDQKWDLPYEQYRYISELLYNRMTLIAKLDCAKHYLKTESDDVKTETIVENLIDIAGEEPMEMSTGPVRSNPAMKSGQLTINDFPTRPIKIYSKVINAANSAYFIDQINPYALLTRNTTLRSKMKNSAFFRADLCLRTTVSGNIFHRGGLRGAYYPFGAYNPTLQECITYPIDTKNLARRYFSQCPYNFLIQPKDNEPVDLRVPWIAPLPMGRLFNTATPSIGSATNFEDFQDLGVFIFASQNTVVNSSNSPTFPDVTVEILAWFENVVMTGATATILQLDTESELKKGPVENFASNTSKFLKMISTIPAIQPYAMASKMVSDGVGSAAALMGWSQPPKPFNVQRVREDAYTNEANIIGQQMTRRITLDPLQETTVDPSICGSNCDETSIGFLSEKWGLLDTFRWNPVDQDNIVWSAGVTPMAAAQDLNTTLVKNRVCPTPLAFSAHPFTFWRGDIEYKLEFITGKLDRGKIAIFFEPNVGQSTLIMASTLSMNKQHVLLADLQEVDEVTFKIGWCHHAEWLENMSNSTISASVDASSYATWRNQMNGFIYIRPFTKLTTPDDDGIDVNVYVRGRNMRYNYPDNARLPQDRVLLNTESASIDLVDYKCDDSNINSDYFGETVSNLRSLLHRYWREYLIDYVSNPVAQSPNQWFAIQNRFYPKNALPYGSTTTNPTMWDYLRLAYLGMKGGIRRRTNIVGFTPTTYSFSKVSLRSMETTDPTLTLTNFLSADNTYVIPTLRGTSTYLPAYNGIEFELPYYNRNLFLPSFTDHSTHPAIFKIGYLRGYDFAFSSPSAISSTTNNFIQGEAAISEDFNLMGFMGSPMFATT